MRFFGNILIFHAHNFHFMLIFSLFSLIFSYIMMRSCFLCQYFAVLGCTSSYIQHEQTNWYATPSEDASVISNQQCRDACSAPTISSQRCNAYSFFSNFGGRRCRLHRGSPLAMSFVRSSNMYLHYQASYCVNNLAQLPYNL